MNTDIMKKFDIYGDFLHAQPYGSGHINHTYKAEFNQAGRTVHYLFQRINDTVFKDPESLMGNISRICNHMKRMVEAEGGHDRSRRIMTLLRFSDGRPWGRDGEGHYWRCYLFIEGTLGYDVVQNTEQAREAARCFGEYLCLLSEMPGGRLSETIPDFHNTPKRMENLLAAVEADPENLAAGVKKELSFFLDRQDGMAKLIRLMEQGIIPERVTHNDSKLNNVLIDTATNKGMCVVDLDTSMPGLSLYDFGDLVRTSTCPVPEDHPHPNDVVMDFKMFEALVAGFLEPGLSFLNQEEIAHLPEGARMITLEVGMRFLTDYLLGNPYFKTAYPNHNLIRCRTQMALVQSIENQMDRMLQHISGIVGVQR